MKYIGLFSGIEAASVAWKPLGWEPIAFCEFDETPSKVLAKNFPDIPNLGDVTKVDWNKCHGTANIVVGGSPCQSFSIADACPALLRHDRNDPPCVWGGGYPFRRLAAEECEALQGFPSGWTDCLRYRGRIGVLGDSMAVPVMRWIGRGIDAIGERWV